MNVYECQRSQSFSDLGPISLVLHVLQHFKVLFLFNHWLISIKFHMHMTKMFAMAIYGKNLKTSSSPGPLGHLP